VNLVAFFDDHFLTHFSRRKKTNKKWFVYEFQQQHLEEGLFGLVNVKGKLSSQKWKIILDKNYINSSYALLEFSGK